MDFYDQPTHNSKNTAKVFDPPLCCTCTPHRSLASVLAKQTADVGGMPLSAKYITSGLNRLLVCSVMSMTCHFSKEQAARR
eukprot:2265193-Amphidinium_carterae.1